MHAKLNNLSYMQNTSLPNVIHRNALQGANVTILEYVICLSFQKSG